MHVEHTASPTSFQGKGIVYIAWDEDEQRYRGYWERAPDGPPASLERLPHTPDMEAALTWALERTPIVMIRPHFAPGETYWGGGEPIPERFSELPPLPQPKEP